MKRKLEREQLYFELFWTVITTFIAYINFYDGFMYSKEPDLQAIAYTTFVFVLPILVSTKIYCDLFQLKYDEFEAKNKDMNKVIININKYLNGSLLYVMFASVAFLMLAFSMGLTIHILKYLKK